jgi:hypothetical protein
MPTTLTIRDETASGQTTREFTLEVLAERCTVRDLIRSRVYQEVKDYNRRRPETFSGLVAVEDAAAAAGGPRRRQGTLDWRVQFARAVEAFEAGRVLVLVAERQAQSLEDEIEVAPSTSVSFVKLVPLVGG